MGLELFIHASETSSSGGSPHSVRYRMLRHIPSQGTMITCVTWLQPETFFIKCLCFILLQIYIN